MTIAVKKSHLQGKYSWEAVANDDPKAIKFDARLFNRREGYEVIPMIQKVVNHFDYETETNVHRVEALIQDELPGNVRDLNNVFEWLVTRLS